MNKRTIIASLNHIANTLDSEGMFVESSRLTKVMVKIADEFNLNDEDGMSEEDDRDDCCPKCGNCVERDGNTEIMGRFSNGVIDYCTANNCDYSYWNDALEGIRDLICPICRSEDFYFEYETNPFSRFQCESCQTEFIEGEEVK